MIKLQCSAIFRWGKIHFIQANSNAKNNSHKNADTKVSIFWHIHLVLNPPILAIEEAGPPFYPDPRLRCEYTTLSLNLAYRFQYRYLGLHNLWQPDSLAVIKWRENEKMKRKGRGNEEMEIDSFSLFSHFLFNSSLSIHFLYQKLSHFAKC